MSAASMSAPQAQATPEGGQGVSTLAIDRIFRRLSYTYMSDFDRVIGELPIAEVKSIWAHELEAFFRNRKSMMRIAWALENLPERVPNVIAFRNLCRQAPSVEQPTLPMPKANPERLAAELSKLGGLRASLATTPGTSTGKAWAHRIIAEAKTGAKMNPTRLRMARQALGLEA